MGGAFAVNRYAMPLHFMVWVGMTLRIVLFKLLCSFTSCCITDSISSLKE